jgi:hypothetical protein
MEVNFHLRNLDTVGVAAPVRNAPKEMPTSAAYEEVALENSRALTVALHETPEIRADIVRRATELVGEPSYPPPETIRKISHLLAIQLHQES